MTSGTEWVNSTKFVNERKRPLSVVRDRFFRQEMVAQTENIETVVQENFWEVAPFVVLGAPAAIIGGSEFGQDAVKKARSVCEKARDAIAARDGETLDQTTEALSRTLNMFKGVVSKTRPG